MASIMTTLPQTGRLEVDIKVTADVNVSAYAAKQKVNGFVLSEISVYWAAVSTAFSDCHLD